MRVEENGGIKFLIVSKACKIRAQSLFTKEPETIAWIQGFPPNSVLWDIGANVGCYSLYAASLGHKVVAVEPSPWTFATLCENIRLNGFEDRIIPFGVLATDHTSLMSIGFHEPGRAQIKLGTGIQTPATTIASLAAQYSLDNPTHIKIDTDGHDFHALHGADCLLPKVQSVIVEMGHNRNTDRDISLLMEIAGFASRGFYKSPMGMAGPVGMTHWYR